MLQGLRLRIPDRGRPAQRRRPLGEHLSQPGRQLRLSEPGMTVTGQRAQVGRVRRTELPNPLILSPDLGAQPRCGGGHCRVLVGAHVDDHAGAIRAADEVVRGMTH
jgi:hypothetical protein